MGSCNANMLTKGWMYVLKGIQVTETNTDTIVSKRYGHGEKKSRKNQREKNKSTTKNQTKIELIGYLAQVVD
jgi:hypothetical protein